jgi:hypothetical protein
MSKEKKYSFKDLLKKLESPYSDNPIESYYYKEKYHKLLCDCGNLQTHRAIFCHDCGGKFYQDPTKVSLVNVIRMKNDFGETRFAKKNFGTDWWYALLTRSFNYEFSIKDFRRAYKQVMNLKDD